MFTSYWKTLDVAAIQPLKLFGPKIQVPMMTPTLIHQLLACQKISPGCEMVGRAPWDRGPLNNQPHTHLISRGYLLGISYPLLYYRALWGVVRLFLLHFQGWHFCSCISSCTHHRWTRPEWIDVDAYPATRAALRGYEAYHGPLISLSHFGPWKKKFELYYFPY